jgi:hypothetical protein
VTLAHSPVRGRRRTVAVNFDLTHGRHGATARLELHERGGGRVALLALGGWIDRTAEGRLEATLDDLAARGASQGYVLCGLSHYLRDLFRLAGCDRALRCWPSADELLEAADQPGAGRERAS